jgi:chorismate mutase
MQINTVKLIVLAFTICSIKSAPAQDAIDKLQPLIASSVQRLTIADQVAFAKADSGAAVEDTVREGQVITNAVQEGATKGLAQNTVSDFFKAQIEANKIVQYSLLSEWRRAGKVPEHPAVNLAKVIRPELDQLQTKLIAELADIAAIRSSATCRVDVAKATGKYRAEHATIDALHAVALDRSLATVCAP